MNKEIATAKLGQYRHSPRKVRLVADLIRGKKIDRALLELDFLGKKASLPIKKLLNSAVANSGLPKTELNNLIVKKILVDEGAILYRRRFRARGQTMPIRKRTSKITVVLGHKKNASKSEVIKNKS